MPKRVGKSMKTHIVVDLDGTLANIDHRLRFIRGDKDKKDWNGFYGAVGQDTINEWCVELIRAFRLAGYSIVIVSARRQSCLEETKKWLLNNHIFLHQNFMGTFELFLLRKNNDYTPDVDLKRDWLHKFGKDKILFVVDDRARVVNMWREEGLVCLQCADWEEKN